MRVLTRREAVKILKELIGKDLRHIGQKYGVTVFKNGKLNKGWAGHTLEKYLGLGLSSKQAPNGEFWELKVVPLCKLDDRYEPKETMAITLIDPADVAEKDFEHSHLFSKLRSLIICGRHFEDKQESHSVLLSAGTFDLVDEGLKAQVKKDYDDVCHTIRTVGFSGLTGRMGVFVQPRTKGPGHGSTTRAFYARKEFVKMILGLS